MFSQWVSRARAAYIYASEWHPRSRESRRPLYKKKTGDNKWLAAHKKHRDQGTQRKNTANTRKFKQAPDHENCLSVHHAEKRTKCTALPSAIFFEILHLPAGGYKREGVECVRKWQGLGKKVCERKTPKQVAKWNDSLVQQQNVEEHNASPPASSNIPTQPVLNMYYIYNEESTPPISCQNLTTFHVLGV